LAETGYIQIGLSRRLWSMPMKIMPLLALAGLLAFPAHTRAEAAVDCVLERYVAGAAGL
jgi:hypothetical protein